MRVCVSSPAVLVSAKWTINCRVCRLEEDSG